MWKAKYSPPYRDRHTQRVLQRQRKQTPLFGNDGCNWLGAGISMSSHSLCACNTRSLSHWWVNLGVIALFPWTPRLAHTHRNTKEHEAKICSPRLRMQMKTCSYGIQHNTPPSTLQICVTCIACATCWMRAGTRGLLGSPFKQIKNSQGCCRGSPEHFTTDAHDGKRAFFLHCAPLFFITSEVHKHNTTSPREQREPWNKVIDFQESSTLWLVCVCVYTAAAAFHV